MVNAVIRWCLNNTFLVILAMLAVIGGGWYALRHTPVDAIPDIGEKQVIVLADWPGRSPQDVDDQVTYPLTVALQGTPGVKVIRSASGFGFSMVFVIFHDRIDYYWARSRVLERMNVARARLPAGVEPVLGPDATALGQVFWYTVEGEGYDLAELRSLQDWYIRYQLNAVEGVSEVASIGGYVKQYQIDVDPVKMRAHGITLPEITEAVRKSNVDVGAQVLEINQVEFFIRGVGFIKKPADLENVVLRAETGTPLYVKNVATVSLGPEFRRGALDKEGVEAVGGVVVMRYGENPLEVLERVKAKIAQITPGLPQKSLPDGRTAKVKIVPFYDRTGIIHETMDTLKEALTQEALVAALVVFVFLLHLRSSASIVLATLPTSVGISFLVMYALGVDSNIMSLAGLAIAIGDVCDMGLIMTENIYRHIANNDGSKTHYQCVEEGAFEVGTAIVTAVSNTIVSFIPVFALTDQEGKLFGPLAYTKTFAITASAILSITVVPTLTYHLLKPVTWSRRRSALIAVLAGMVMTVVAGFTYRAFFLPSSAAASSGLAAGGRHRPGHDVGRFPHGPRTAPAPGSQHRLARNPPRVRPRTPLGAGAQGPVLESAVEPRADGALHLARLGSGDLSDRGRSGPGRRKRQPLGTLELLETQVAGAGTRVHAGPGRGLAVVHAFARAGRIVDGGAGSRSPARHGHPQRPRGGERRRQSGPGGFGARSGPDRHDRDGGHAQAARPVASCARRTLLRRLAELAAGTLPVCLAEGAADDEGRTARRTPREDRHPRRAAQLAAAHPDPDRDAAERFSRDDGRQDLWVRPAGNRAAGPGTGKDPQTSSRRNRRGCGPDRRQAVRRIPHRSPDGWRVTASTSATCKTSSRPASAATT